MSNQLKRIIAVTLILLTVFSYSSDIKTYAADPANSAFPSIEEIFGGKNKNPYLTKYKDNYYLDMVELSGFEAIKNPESAVNILANILFKVQYYLGYFLVTILYYSFELDIYGMFSPMINAITGEMKIALFDELSTLGIVLLGLYYCIKTIQDQKTQVWVAIIQTVLLVALALAFFANTATLLQGVDDISKDLSQKVLAGTYRATNQGDDPETAVIAASNDVWMMFVHQPWQLLEFGDLEVAEEKEDEILSLSPDSAARKDIIEDLSKDGDLFGSKWGVIRVGFMLLYLVPMAIMFVIMIALCLLILGYQFLTMLYALFGVFIFIIALIPFFGPKVVGNWGSKILGSGLIKVIISFVMAILFAFNRALFKLSGTYGWIVVLFIQLVVAVMIVIKRKTFLEMITNMRMTVQNGNMNRQLKRDINLESRINEYTNRVGIRRNSGYKDYADDEWSETTDKDGVVFTRANASRNDANIGRNDKGLNNIADKSTAVDTIPNQIESGMVEIKSDFGSNIDNVNESLKSLTKKAEQLLERKYEDEKIEAEEKANKAGKEPEYSQFVRKVQTREALGAQRFENREITAVVNSIQRAQKSGGTVDDVYKGSLRNTEVQEVSRPQSIESVEQTIKLQMDSQESTNLDKNEAYKVIQESIAKELTKEFNEDYGKQYDKAFFEELIKRYGKENIRLMLKRMKEVQTREGKEINNPAGYLTTSLKNNKRDKVFNSSSSNSGQNGMRSTEKRKQYTEEMEESKS